MCRARKSHQHVTERVENMSLKTKRKKKKERQILAERYGSVLSIRFLTPTRPPQKKTKTEISKPLYHFTDAIFV